MGILLDLRLYLGRATVRRMRPTAIQVCTDTLNGVLAAYARQDQSPVRELPHFAQLSALYGEFLKDWTLFDGVVLHLPRKLLQK